MQFQPTQLIPNGVRWVRRGLPALRSQGRRPSKARENPANILVCVRKCYVAEANTSTFALRAFEPPAFWPAWHIQEEGTQEVSRKKGMGCLPASRKRGMAMLRSRERLHLCSGRHQPVACLIDCYSNRFSLCKQSPAALALST